MGARQSFTVLMTCIKLNRNAPLVQQRLKMLPSRPNALCIPVEHFVNRLEFLLKYHRGCWLIQSVGMYAKCYHK